MTVYPISANGHDSGGSRVDGRRVSMKTRIPASQAILTMIKNPGRVFFCTTDVTGVKMAVKWNFGKFESAFIGDVNFHTMSMPMHRFTASTWFKAWDYLDIAMPVLHQPNVRDVRPPQRPVYTLDEAPRVRPVGGYAMVFNAETGMYTMNVVGTDAPPEGETDDNF